ncbi:uncharacterized protein EURHEDRAFT_342913 [Aspergillus ruber CBS 135680]|uniref:Uncharacterized protein n=1 Tax=Aspergillus ruber (strain CBS 135680) TaxID=1388766 RepID=A0A017SKT1_ASPRC|nr:uncharacterized protein EURHEDRAFT_342913 [Aspergillus ruber CBS 135680]EYE96930.1 hypothetical protein EURHEDRAFT_342913 [Aspergillus ruber CBS 135680]
MRFPYSYFLRSSLLSGHFVEVEVLFIRIRSRETKIWCGFLLHFHLQTGFVMVIFLSRRWFSFIFFSCTLFLYLGWLSVVFFFKFFFCHFRVHADVYMLGSLAGGFVIFFSIYHLRKGGRLISISFRFTRGVHVLLFSTYLISNLGGCLINYLSVMF